MNLLNDFLTRLLSERAVLVRVDACQGSVPRGVGAWMAVFAQHQVNTVGGGHLELQALTQARALLRGGQASPVLRYALGPSLGQCCGGVVDLAYETVQATDAEALRRRLQPDRQAVALFGGGHVGQALVRVLLNLPFEVCWIDSRDEIFPSSVPAQVRCEHCDPVHSAVGALEPGSRVLIMSFSHAEDLDVVAACLQRLRERDDLPYVGLIGSKSKWASFRSRLRLRGFGEAELERVTCPIGVSGILGKEPEVIAVAVAAQLLQQPDWPAARRAD